MLRSAPIGRLEAVNEAFSGGLETQRADNLRLRRLLDLSEEQARAARPDQATLAGAPTPPVIKTHRCTTRCASMPTCSGVVPMYVPSAEQA
jgi:hypothetical protein